MVHSKTMQRVHILMKKVNEEKKAEREAKANKTAFLLRLTERCKEILNAKSSTAGLTKSDYLRKLIQK